MRLLTRYALLGSLSLACMVHALPSGTQPLPSGTQPLPSGTHSPPPQMRPPPPETLPAQLYELTTETGMPHLEENLRYTTRHERVCLTHQILSDAFPILQHPSLQGCRLQAEPRQGDSVAYALLCTGSHGTTGQAIWHLEPHRFSGTLNIKLGGKNMTFYQRITAVPLGPC